MNAQMEQLDKAFSDLFLKKLPQLSEQWKKSIVGILPWIAVVTAVLALPAIFALLGLGTFFGAISYGMMGYRGMGFAGALGIFGVLSLIVSISSLLLTILAIPGLFNQKMKAWTLLYWASLIGIVSSLLSRSIGGVFWQLVELYILYQVKDRYK